MVTRLPTVVPNVTEDTILARRIARLRELFPDWGGEAESPLGLEQRWLAVQDVRLIELLNRMVLGTYPQWAQDQDLIDLAKLYGYSLRPNESLEVLRQRVLEVPITNLAGSPSSIDRTAYSVDGIIDVFQVDQDDNQTLVVYLQSRADGSTPTLLTEVTNAVQADGTNNPPLDAQYPRQAQAERVAALLNDDLYRNAMHRYVTAAPEWVTYDVNMTISGGEVDTVRSAVVAFAEAQRRIGRAVVRGQLVTTAINAGANDATVTAPAVNIAGGLPRVPVMQNLTVVAG